MRWMGIGLALIMALPAVAASAGTSEYGVGLLCPKADSQVVFYTENNQQDASGSLAFDKGAGFIVTSDTVKDLDAAGAHVVDALCDGAAQGLRIDGKRDGWLQAGKMWLPPNQEWDYSDWQDFLHKAAIWKPLGAIALFQGTQDAPLKDKAYAEAQPKGPIEIYPLKFSDDYALVLLDESDAFAKGCAGNPTPPAGRLGWMRLSADDGRPQAVPAHTKGCEAP